LRVATAEIIFTIGGAFGFKKKIDREITAET
jgi:hypothetical protein